MSPQSACRHSYAHDQQRRLRVIVKRTPGTNSNLSCADGTAQQQYQPEADKLLLPTLQIVDRRSRAVCWHRQQVLPQHDCVVSTEARRQLNMRPTRPRALKDVEHVREELRCQRLQQATSACALVICLQAGRVSDVMTETGEAAW